MRIGIIGAGNIGGTIGALWARAGHEVVLSNSRGPESLADLIESIGANARAATVDEAAEFGEVVLLAVPWRRQEALPSPDLVRGKIVIDATNAYAEGGGVADLGDSTSSEETAKRLPGARLVKAFNTMYWERLRDQGHPDAPPDDRLAVFVAGDDLEAKRIVAGLINEIGFTAVDTGLLREGGRSQQPGSPIYNVPISGSEARKMIEANR
jgi:predicted dinucleotide-binding enzyme